MAFTLESLAAIIAERARAGGERSYTRKLLDEGTEKCAKKLGEEAMETALAAISGENKAVVAESADLLYHLLVVLESRGVALAD
ncbi:MAG: phosphoribosyl-ATP diphosphatase, partial [Phycisphaerales bacterium]|nr:phosphoribosyl-ATP diphosphatase [Phycisphaerales bacterium]